MRPGSARMGKDQTNRRIPCHTISGRCSISASAPGIRWGPNWLTLPTFSDGNGRIARIVMNAELSRTGDARIIIPTLFHEEFSDCQRQLTHQNDPAGFIRAVALMQRWTIAFDFSDTDALIEAIKATNALEHSRAQFKLTMPDNSSKI